GLAPTSYEDEEADEIAEQVEAPAKFVGEEKFSSSGEDRGSSEMRERSPFEVPTFGAFYMHDDRCRRRHRQAFNGRKLLLPKDDEKWKHDKFQEMMLNESHQEEEKKSAKVHSNNKRNIRRIARGRGPVRYKPLKKNSYENFLAKRQHSDQMTCKNKLSASSSSNDSSLVHPLPSSSQEVTLTKNRDMRCRSTRRNLFSSIVPGNMLQPGQKIANCMERSTLGFSQAAVPVVGHQLISMPVPLSVVPPAYIAHFAESLALSGPLGCPSISPFGLANPSSSQIRYHAARLCIPQSSFRPSPQVLGRHLDQQSQTGCSSPTQAVSPYSVVDIHGVWPSQELDTRGALSIGNEMCSFPRSGRGPYAYSGICDDHSSGAMPQILPGILLLSSFYCDFSTCCSYVLLATISQVAYACVESRSLCYQCLICLVSHWCSCFIFHLTSVNFVVLFSFLCECLSYIWRLASKLSVANAAILLSPVTGNGLQF
ncbi:Btz domain, partial [Dillenia turbinata]